MTDVLAPQRFFRELSVGDELPPQSAAPDEVQTFFHVAALFTGHRIHYDVPYASEREGYPGIVVPGPLRSALMAKMVTDWMGPLGRLLRISVEYRQSVYIGDALEFRGHVAALTEYDDHGVVELLLSEERDGVNLMPGSAVVALPLDAESGAAPFSLG